MWTPEQQQRLRHRLLDWYGQQGRDLPWRHTRDPYAIWVSEIMLQQTQVTTVLPYFQRWLEQLPHIQDLAVAAPAQVLKLWEGLGYYRRARYLQQAAQQLVAERQGVFPTTLEEAMGLPGIGRTTAAGILSAAFDRPLPILDGNVKRILARLGALPVPPRRATRQLWQWSETLLDRQHPRDFNQALMDLGALICRPRQPHCRECPWQEDCTAYNHRQQDHYPMSEPTPPRPHKTIAVAVVWQGEQLLIDQRLESSMLGGLWEFPGGKIEEGETAAECVVREVKEEIGIDVVVESALTTIDHAYSHFTITLIAFICRYVAGEARALQCSDVRWIYPSQLSEYAFPSANQKLFPALYEWLNTQSSSTS
ncbi:MAG: A/G-specific adenine glycosylase [Cyanobacteriota bacterium]|nr:A/G-specific adenine glycosylase [Cyanobacteriota bacterium]